MHNLIDSYLANQLSAEQQAQFEAQLLYDHALLDELMAAEAMNAGIKHLAAHESELFAPSDSAVPTHSASASAAWVPRLVSQSHGWKFALAAGLCAFVLVPNSIMYSKMQDSEQQLRNAQSLLQPQVNVPETLINSTRSANTDALMTIQFSAQQPWQRVTMELPPPALSQYRVVVANDSGAQTLSFDNLQPDAYDSLSLLLPKSSLKPGIYRLSVFETNSEDSVINTFISVQYQD